MLWLSIPFMITTAFDSAFAASRSVSLENINKLLPFFLFFCNWFFRWFRHAKERYSDTLKEEQSEFTYWADTYANMDIFFTIFAIINGMIYLHFPYFFPLYITQLYIKHFFMTNVNEIRGTCGIDASETAVWKILDNVNNYHKNIKTKDFTGPEYSWDATGEKHNSYESSKKSLLINYFEFRCKAWSEVINRSGGCTDN
uniref:RSN1_TM domain-containing protein n=1 Tax=Heterorhabditis bacteriophora TaxID=37862 RepID=A0A1I7WNW0_HETBA